MRQFPKVELHLHLDGAVSPQLLFSTAKRRNIPLPNDVQEPLDLVKYIAAGPKCQSLTEFLKRFVFFTPIVQGDPIAIREMTLELLQELADQNVFYAELRYNPHFLTSESLSTRQVVEIVSEAVREGALKHKRRFKTILCAMRHFPDWTREIVDLAIEFKESIVGIDLAGDEMHDALPHKAEFDRARENGIRITLHAGETGPAQEVERAISVMGAERIGHGYNTLTDPAVIQLVKDRNTPLGLEQASCLGNEAAPTVLLTLNR
ncbi:hypothetical protein EDD86DRAFT_250486 [Gorgonomyces haynaldii]|nr:hypothetical protein EDD86DRAFT_250486 [Gorgonomyces haynaldii]